MQRLTHAAMAAILIAAPALAKLPPLSDEAKAKAAEAAAKTAWSNKVADFQLCRSMDRVAARYIAEAGKSGQAVKPNDTPACADPGPFVYAPPGAASAPAAAPAASAPAKKA
jgi:hypothetical protein